ncbi:hypothetical protein C1H46_020243 [Malus baccata]|uniref:Uncharacterized protein n=1 Tax=Malus baccata TaxID=106549 RepID=A0A540M667_MALBA|nr:hypothetical protein C1H46_020243 [Malus baccata]
MILQTTFPGPSLCSSFSAHRLRPLLFSRRRRGRTSLSYWHFNPLKPRHFSVGKY